MFNIFDIPPPDPIRLPFTTSPWPITIILAIYTLFILKLGKMFMNNRQPYDLRKILLFYNCLQILYNGIFFSITFYYLIINPICNFRCMETFPLDHPRKNLERFVHYAYYLNKILDLCETIFFVLRKSYKQVSFLHVYHHLIMVGGCYLVMRFYGTGGQLNVLGLLNSFVHVLMYCYYLISATHPGHKNNVWWKKYITIAQIIQFFTIFCYSLSILVFNRDCGYPDALQYILILQSIIMMYMFGSFYVKAYIKPQNKKQL